MMNTFLELIEQEPLDLLQACLCLAQEICYPDLDFSRYLNQVESLAEQARLKLPPENSIAWRAEQLAHFLFQEQGFCGNVQQYHDPRNSYLNDVLERRLGIPISLSVLYLALAERLGVPAQGVGLPGHFIVRVQTENEQLFLDPFHGGERLSVIDCARLVELSTGYSGDFESEWLKPVSPSAILERMLYNLRSIYIQRNEWLLALRVVEHLHLLQPRQPDHLRDLGTICREAAYFQRAIEYFQRYLAQAPEAQDAALVKRNLQETIRKLASRN